MMLKDLELDVAPLVMGAIHMGLVAAGGLSQRGLLPEMLQHSACSDEVGRAIFEHIVEALSSSEDPELGALLDTIEALVVRARAGRTLQ